MKNEIEDINDSRVKRKVITWQKFALTYVIMLFVVGVQTGIIVSPVFNKFDEIVQVNVIMIYCSNYFSLCDKLANEKILW